MGEIPQPGATPWVLATLAIQRNTSPIGEIF
jgi:hypothetical protein